MITYVLSYIQNQTQDPEPTNLAFPNSVGDTNAIIQAEILNATGYQFFPH